MIKVNSSNFVKWIEMLYSNAVYIFGGVGEVITKSVTDELYDLYNSSTYNKDYYNLKLAKYKGKIGVDDVGMFYKFSESNTTVKKYFDNCILSGHISSIPKNRVCLVFNKTFTHIGAYLGNGVTIEMIDSNINGYKEYLKTSKWYYFGIPDFIDYGVPIDTLKKEIDSENNIIINYQKWLNDNLEGSNIDINGIYDENTKVNTIKILQSMLNTYYGRNININGVYDDIMRYACPDFNVLKNNSDAFKNITYIIHIFLYAKCNYLMSHIIDGSKISTVYSDKTKQYVAMYQSMIRGLKVDGICGPTTLYQMFK